MSTSPQPTTQSTVLAMTNAPTHVKVLASGEAGVERAALDAALAAGLTIGGYCPQGRRAEDGPISDRYQLQEASTANVLEPTLYNLQKSNGLVIITRGPLLGPVMLTYQFILDETKPARIIDFARAIPSTDDIVQWVSNNKVTALHIAGLTESVCPGIYQETLEYLTPILAQLKSC